MAELITTSVLTADAELRVNRRVLSVKFGDGYEQRALDGINTLNRTWTVTFTPTSKADTANLEAKLQVGLGHKPVLWQAPDESIPSNWIVRSYTKRPLRGVYLQVSCTFERIFDA